jgi:Golgi phosphoprotein 3
MLTLAEELLLLCLREKRNTVDLSPLSTYLPYALAGAMLVELALAGKVQLDKDKRVLPVGAAQLAENVRLNELLTMIRESPKPKKITHWIGTTAGKGKKLEKELFALLIARGILEEMEDKRIQWVIPNSEYSQQDASVKFLRKQQLRDIVLGRKTADQRSVALLSLLKAIDFLHFIFTQDEIISAKKRVNEIVKDESVGEDVIEILSTISSAAVVAATNIPGS